VLAPVDTSLIPEGEQPPDTVPIQTLPAAPIDTAVTP
jgi:hypothetical protein